MLFLVAYSLFEAPSNLAMKALFPPILITGVVIYQHLIRCLGFLVICFGSLCAGIGSSKNVPTIIPLQFLLGAAEAGVYPGIIFFLSFWYGHENGPSESPSFFVASLWQAPLGSRGKAMVVHHRGLTMYNFGCRRFRVTQRRQSGSLLKKSLFCKPHLVRISLEGKAFSPISMQRLSWKCSDDSLNWNDAKCTLKEARRWMHYFTYLCVGIGVSSLSLSALTLVHGIGHTGLDAHSSLPFLLVHVHMWTNMDVVACVPSPGLHLRYAMLVLCICSVFGELPAIYAWVSDNVHSATAASLASGLNIAFTGPGQIIGVWIYQVQQPSRYQTVHSVNAASQFLAMAFALGLWCYYRRRNAKHAPGEQKWIP
ncbi:hypothetical protein N7499_002393 [Penicillium canescens]|uniref:Uncharacterized protein n=1 Tax=Penicillium canescens TaxID=5083 RepID=A0AAD6I8E8_PENCN|nr:uncharacterized protein N7446_009934 [Penicillium canescens]KAJ6035175.1 hypothetical protein N7460_009350 [Penicillium canescens]KAJ6046833.1 hypothetical protein N7444_008087 [Penicillium canescens]KAJ6053922.1 hypothetical protein N7446_009934 [Penicillium canescens]KAJ6098019.1 hypothetical protein N7499_002393 [Penicillium canescens]KAJ6166006.1 hypothetical protein N7485_009250 [Penicillium canescens]